MNCFASPVRSGRLCRFLSRVVILALRLILSRLSLSSALYSPFIPFSSSTQSCRFLLFFSSDLVASVNLSRSFIPLGLLNAEVISICFCTFVQTMSILLSYSTSYMLRNLKTTCNCTHIPGSPILFLGSLSPPVYPHVSDRPQPGNVTRHLPASLSSCFARLPAAGPRARIRNEAALTYGREIGPRENVTNLTVSRHGDVTVRRHD